MADIRIYNLPTTTENAGKYFAIDQDGLVSAQRIAADSFYLKSETDALLDGYYTKAETDALLGDFYTKGETDALLANYYTSSQVDDLFLPYYTSAQVDQLLTLYYTKVEVDNILTNYYTITESDALIEARLKWRGEWVADDYLVNDVVRDGNWLMVANKATTDKPAPQPSGDPYYIYTGIPTAETALASQVIFGTRYTWEQGGYLTGFRLYTHSGIHYRIFSVRDPLGTPIVSQVMDFTAVDDGWQDKVIEQMIVQPGAEFDLVALANEPDPTPITWTGDWNYTTPNNENTPGVGTASQATKVPEILKVNKTDQASADRGAELLALNIGDTIEANGTTWIIQSITDSGNVVEFGVNPATQASPDGVTTFTFSTVTATPIPYEEDAGFWNSNPYTQGLFGANLAYENIIPDQNAYGIDVQVQQASVSEDWDVMALSGGSGGGSGGGSTGGIVWLGSTANAVGTYENDTIIRAQANLLFDGTELSTPSIKLSLGSTVDNIETTLTDNTDRIATSSAIFTALGAVASPWNKTGATLSPTTAGDDILLNIGENLYFRNTSTGLISQTEGGMRLLAETLPVMDFYASNINTYKGIFPVSDNTIKLADANAMWAGVSSHKYEIGKTAIYIAYSGDSMTFTDSVTGTKTLAELAEPSISLWERTDTNLGPATTGDDILLATSSERLAYGDGSTYVYSPATNEVAVCINSTVKVHFTNTETIVYTELVPGNPKLYDIGKPTSFWDNAYIDRLYIDNTGSYIDADETGMTLTDATGTYQLSDLVGGGVSWGTATNKYVVFGSASGELQSSSSTIFDAAVVNSASAVAYTFDTDNILATGSAKIISLSTGGQERGYLTSAGIFHVSGSFQVDTNFAGTDYASISSSWWQVYRDGVRRLSLYPAVADGATAVAYGFATENNLTTTGAKLFSLYNYTSEKFFIDKDGNVDLAVGAEYRINGVSIFNINNGTYEVGSGGPLTYEPPVGTKYVNINASGATSYVLYVDLDLLESTTEDTFVFISYNYANPDAGMEIRNSANQVMRSLSGAPALQEGGWLFRWNYVSARWESSVLTAH